MSTGNTHVRSCASCRIVWPNLELSAWSRFSRRMVVNALVFGLLAISTTMIIAAQSQHARFSLGESTAALCGTTLPAIAYNVSLTREGLLAPGATLPAGNPTLSFESNSIACPSGYSRFFWGNLSGVLPITSPNAPGCLAECLPETSQNPGSLDTCIYVSLPLALCFVKQDCTLRALCNFVAPSHRSIRVILLK